MDQDIITALTLIHEHSRYIVTNNKNLKVQYVHHDTLFSRSTDVFCKAVTLLTTPLSDQIRFINEIPNAYVASKILATLGTHGTNNISSCLGLYWVLVQYVCDEGDIKNGPCLTCTLHNNNDSISSLVILIKGLGKISRRSFGIRLYMHGHMNDVERLTHLPNLNELWYHEKNQNSLDGTINNWLSFLSFQKNSWTSLKHLNLPYFKNVVLLFKILYYLPSLETIFVAVKPDVAQAIPILKHCLKVLPLDTKQLNGSYTFDNGIIPIEICDTTFQDKERELDHLEGTLYCVVKPLCTNEDARQIASKDKTATPTSKPKLKINRSRVNRRFLDKYK
ncbi:hypothetical protein C6P45_001166 [Maudiozyma exigua]|uniref:Uncharacterized protein n=1 Tax=Maudiozyma exigua TaxID=34358 RepID=A0A9P7BD22_MAUEX|nr:hypothetical protein C6P45_001166 [Kazachstania exigua]